MIEKAWIPCNACGADAFRPLSKVGEWQIGQCANCSLIYVNPAPFFKANTVEFSEISLDFQYTRFMYAITSEKVQFEREQLRRQGEEVARFTGCSPRSLRFLDMGCGSGQSVRAAVDLGWEAVGVDIDQVLIDLGKKQLHVDLRCTDLLESGFGENQFHFVRLRDVIEHLPYPYDVLVEVKRILAPGGVGLITTPNEDGLPNRLRLLFGHKRDKVATVPPPHHLHGFTPKTLGLLLDRAGLKTLLIRTTTPVDASYVTANNMRSATNPVYVLAWTGARAIGKGSMVIAWVQKQG